MIQFIGRRIAFLTVMVFAMIVALFLLSHVIPADPARVAVGPQATEEAVLQMREEMGLHEPLIVQLWVYLKGVFRLDLGMSINDNQPVTDSIVAYAPASVELAIVAMGFSIIVGGIAGLLSAAFPGTLLDGMLQFTTILGRAFAPFWLAILLQLIFYGNLGWFPSGTRLNLSQVEEPTHITGMYLFDSVITGNFDAFVNAGYHIVLPAFALGLGGVAEISRMTRAMVLSEMTKDYVRTARAKGLRGSNVLLRHAFRNALNPVVTIIGIRFGYLLAGTVLIETIFRWPGIGRYSLLAIANLDFPAIIGVTLFVTITFAAVNLLVDIFYGFLEPRIRHT